jgi:hypothetical protein
MALNYEYFNQINQLDKIIVLFIALVIGFVFPLFLRGPHAFVLSMIGTVIGLIAFCSDGEMRYPALIVVAFDFATGMVKLIPCGF